ncbi:DUF3710 domain-containing protein [Cellulosimicrobium cellulans]|uniref:DUF3710 domain-containing protein n=1 Tax=Cellulosimicrobium TaxID=157920 RepID=UPI000D3A4BAE|nr:DUF3710 domain-containing protein [Sphaerisporangium cinnabarinum]MCR1981860.1 DUF3710 domain-containing protein [Cellulosimicrobium cellulans]PTU57742.1 DUF3710 domain-containing protein [Sphaerisporangium cinnabarinum]
MGLFRRSRSSEPAESPEPSGTTSEQAGDGAPAPEAAAEAPARGPYDSSQVPERGPRLDLGAVWLPGVPGMELRMEVDKKTQRITGVACAVGGSGLQVQAFAAPRTEGIWDEIRGEIAASVTKQGGTVDDLPGPFGRELLARIPAQTPDGRPGVRPARFVGVDGPRWFLRGVLTGKAAVDPAEARLLESVFANIVVVRDQNPRPPRDLLTLHLPGKGPDAAAAPTPAGAPETPSFDPLTRGPEITEIR